ncbi:IPT/TIG domain-containing protein [Nocardia sp. CNY236]|uniref:IPT/TIG domain-containing protein n=1 Tax=Nocardia sp. CNY236 TaxID=1169152 RepID=UPI0003FF4A24|nr:IPT/TIG domain-containing protein [Nocardia sp. CNY236]
MAPVLTSLDPGFGPASGGNTVQIFGSGFTGAGPLTVRFGATATTFTIVSDTRIDAIAPPGTGTVDVTVTALGGASNPLPYTYNGAGLLFFTDLNPGNVYSVPQTGGGTPTLLASGLSISTGLVRVGGLLYVCEFSTGQLLTVPVTGGTPTPLVTGLLLPRSVTVSGSTLFITNGGTSQVVSAPITGTATPTVVATSPTGVFGITDGLVSQPGVVPVAAALLAAPVLTSLDPSFGPESGGNTVQISGTGFTGAGPLTVRFGATTTTFAIVSDTRINAIAPPGTGTVGVTVTGSGGTSNSLPYTYGGLLFFTDATPDSVYSVPQTGGTPTLLASGMSTPAGLVRVGNLLYICELGANRVVTVPITGGTPTPLVTGLSAPRDITVTGNTLFITNGGTSQVMSAPITGTATPTVVATSPTGVFGIAN